MKFKWDRVFVSGLLTENKTKASCLSSSLLPLPTNHEIGLKIKNTKRKKEFTFLPPPPFELPKYTQVCSEVLLHDELRVLGGWGNLFVCLFVSF